MATNYDDVNDDKTKHEMASSRRQQPQGRFLERLFEEKCLISVQQDELMLVQESVEKFVSEVIKRVLQDEPYQNFIQAFNRKCILEFDGTFNANKLLTVGSFYEQTKNNYPDEFDFIFVLAEGQFKDNKRIQEITSDLSDLFHEQLRDLLSGTCFKYGGGQIESYSYTGLHGPASKIKLVFNNELNLRNRTIYVDISMASRLQLGKCLPKELQVCYDEWKTLLLETGSCLVIKVYKKDHPKHKTGVKFTITETEQYFVRHKMSEKHQNVYRLLKYLFNGNEENNRIKNMIRRPENKQTILSKVCFEKEVSPRVFFDLPSYAIKTLMFHHVHRCQHKDGAIEECLKSVLNNLLQLFTDSEKRIKTLKQAKTSFDVSLTTMLGQPLEVADDYGTAVEITMKLSQLLKCVQNHERETEITHSTFYELIPFTEQKISTVSKRMDFQSRKRRLYKQIAILSFSCFVSFSLIIFIIVRSFSTSMSCDTKNPTPGNTANNAQYCCTGTKDEAIIWRNVTCARKNIFLGFSVNASENYSTETIQYFLPMTSADAHVNEIRLETGSNISACFVVRLGKEIADTAKENSTVTCCRDTDVESNGTNEDCIDSDNNMGDTLIQNAPAMLFVIVFILPGIAAIFYMRVRRGGVYGGTLIRKIETIYEEASVQQTSL